MRRAFPEIKDDAMALKKALEKGVSAKTQTHNKGFGLDTVISCLEEGAQTKAFVNLVDRMNNSITELESALKGGGLLQSEEEDW